MSGFQFFETLCRDDHPMKETSSTLIQRGKLSTESGTCRSVYLWKFPSLHEGTWLQKAEAFLRVTAHIGNYIRHFHGIIYVHGIDDDEDGEAFELFRSLIGEDGLTRSLLLSGDPIEPDTENMGLPKAVLPLVSRGACSEIIERFLEPSHIPVPSLFQLEIANGKPMGNTAAGILFDKRLKDARGTLECAFGLIYGKIVSPPVSPPSKSSTPRRRSRTVALANELSETRRQLSELEHAYTTLGCNSSEQVSDLEESNKELRSENESLRAEIESLKDALNHLRQKTARNQADTRIKDHVEKQLTEAKSQIDSVKKQASAGISQLKESLAEKESQVREIARAAEVWTLASVEVKRLKEELKLLQVCRETGEREAHSERQRLQVELRQANEEWAAERMRLEADISSLGRNNEALRDQLEVLSKERDNEADGYMARIAELEHWCEQRWDAVGNNCVIA
ncbi:hypothetical protein FRC11_008036 [Ceratobasidium sp. 423]|nr:hypothetical protein FRC11_008036 [Ceratobasidium sp. 423]